MRPGDRVRIAKPNHPAIGRAGIVLGFGEIHGENIAYVATQAPHESKAWPIYVLYLRHVELVAETDAATSRRLVEEIIEAAERRGCPLRGIYSWAGPYKPKNKIY